MDTKHAQVTEEHRKLSPAFWRTRFVEQFRRDLIAGLIVRESDGEPWPYTEREAQQIADRLYERLAGALAAEAERVRLEFAEEVVQLWEQFHDCPVLGTRIRALAFAATGTDSKGQNVPAPERKP